jgi:GH25 family lysozyme M1 (1,4-beta-N-acetylmuramidase)
MKNSRKKIIVTVLIILIIIVTVLAILLMGKNTLDDETVETVEVMYTQDQVDELTSQAYLEGSGESREELLSEIAASLENGVSILETLRPYYPDDIILAGKGTYYFVPIKDTIPRNSYQQENLEILESGEYRYLENGVVTSHKGIDVSSHQGNINWKKAAADGVEFAFIRALYRGYGASGKLVEDERFDANMSGAIAAGIPVGIYVYTQAITQEEILEEAQLAIAKAAKYTDSCRIVVDVEKVAESEGRMNALEVSERTELVALFCQTVEEAGYTPMVYCNMEMAALMLDMEKLKDYDIWFAGYTDTMYYPYDYCVWQYSEKGTVDGIEGAVDLDLSFTEILSK